LVWRAFDNWTAFTDGYRTWVNGPLGVQQRLNTECFSWEAGCVGAQPPPSPQPLPRGPAGAAVWLDAPPRGWNLPGAAVPVVRSDGAGCPRLGLAGDPERAPSGPEEQQVAAAGWRLLSAWPTVRAGGVAVVLGTAGYDGMCRPSQFNGFAFVGGNYAGTISPQDMESRTDGALSQGPSVTSEGRVEVAYVRYAASDALCCPSRGLTRVTYRINGGALVPITIGDVGPAAPPPPTSVTTTASSAATCVARVEASVQYPSRGGGDQTVYVGAFNAAGNTVSGATGGFVVHYETVTRAFTLSPTGSDGRTQGSWNVGGPVGWVPVVVTMRSGGCTASAETGFQGR
jgi:hypothetical protein